MRAPRARVTRSVPVALPSGMSGVGKDLIGPGFTRNPGSESLRTASTGLTWLSSTLRFDRTISSKELQRQRRWRGHPVHKANKAALGRSVPRVYEASRVNRAHKDALDLRAAQPSGLLAPPVPAENAASKGSPIFKMAHQARLVSKDLKASLVPKAIVVSTVGMGLPDDLENLVLPASRESKGHRATRARPARLDQRDRPAPLAQPEHLRQSTASPAPPASLEHPASLARKALWARRVLPAALDTRVSLVSPANPVPTALAGRRGSMARWALWVRRVCRGWTDPTSRPSEDPQTPATAASSRSRTRGSRTTSARRSSTLRRGAWPPPTAVAGVTATWTCRWRGARRWRATHAPSRSSTRERPSTAVSTTTPHTAGATQTHSRVGGVCARSLQREGRRTAVGRARHGVRRPTMTPRGATPTQLKESGGSAFSR
mmetsp:Transcript_51990/g.121869  ORF Transcript_51990/g.121869 Transcript_51990/m.121869 type:complete len:432 (+) Transcript_51990:330-1625(+)